MKPILKWGLMGLLVLVVVIVALGLWQREKVTRLLAVNSLFSENRIVGNFIAMNGMFKHVEMPLSSAPPNRLETGAPMAPPDGFTDWIENRSVTAVIVVKDGIIRHESYPLTADGEDDPASSLRISWSVAKSYLSVLMGILHDDGTIPDRRGSITVDDEGTPSAKNTLIEDGVLVGYMQDRQNARLMGVDPTGNGRRESYAHAPMPRMTNTYMLGGDAEPEAIVRDL